MSYTDYQFGERVMALRVQEEQRQAELHRRQREARKAYQGWLSQQRCWLLCQWGSLFMSLGVRLLHTGAPQPRLAGKQMLLE